MHCNVRLCRVAQEKIATQLALEKQERGERLKKEKVQVKLQREVQKKREAAVRTLLVIVSSAARF